MESNLRRAGKSESEIKLLVGEWFKGSQVFQSGGSQEEYYKATQHLQNDSFCIILDMATNRHQKNILKTKINL